jgi:DnaJ like chaperone protein
MFWKRKEPKADSDSVGAERLATVVREHLSGADEATTHIVVAVAGLLASVAYADRDFSADEEAKVIEELGRVQGLTAEGPRAVCAALRDHVLELSTTQTPRFARTLVELADRDLRLEVLRVLIELAAADGTISLDEVNHLRLLTRSLGLTQDDYNQLQARHRDKLASLR